MQEIDRTVALQELGLTDDQFIDLCILMGCDYCGTIRGIGAVRALQLIKVRLLRPSAGCRSRGDVSYSPGSGTCPVACKTLALHNSSHSLQRAMQPGG